MAEREAPEQVEDRQDARELHAAFVAARDRDAGLSFAALQQRLGASFRGSHGLDVKQAAHYESFAKAFELTAAERAKLDELGFVVIPARASRGAGPVDVYYRVFAADLPVFVSADSVLHAWHRSYDAILEHTERQTLLPLLSELLGAVEAAIDASDAGADDARLYLGVARALLGGEVAEAPPPPEGVSALVAAVYAEVPQTVDLLGRDVEIDFSQFKPRGHYAEGAFLDRYFRAMTWLGLVDLRLHHPHADVTREERAARALVSALARSRRSESFELLDRFYRAHVGRPNALTPLDLAELCRRAGAPACSGDKASSLDLNEHYLAQGRASYGGGSHPDEVSMRWLPKRFASDAWVTTKLTAPRLPAVTTVNPVTGASESSARLMATPYDVAFALGSDRALQRLEAEAVHPYSLVLPQHLAATRAALQENPPVELDETLYNRWLQGLMAVAKTDVREALPRVLQTEAWHDHKLETLLASWAELRHDTVLVVEQSMGMLGCQYPKGYVEPVPELYRELALAADALALLYVGKLRSGEARAVKDWAKHFGEVMLRLARIAEEQLRGEPLNASDLAFMNRTVDLHVEEGYGGRRAYDGWYPALFFQLDWRRAAPAGSQRPPPFVAGGRAEPIVVDVHTDGHNHRALQVATGYPELMIVAIDQGGDVSLYGGPVSSFFTFERPSSARMTNEEWRRALYEPSKPSRPAFARRYRAE